MRIIGGPSYCLSGDKKFMFKNLKKSDFQTSTFMKLLTYFYSVSSHRAQEPIE